MANLHRLTSSVFASLVILFFANFYGEARAAFPTSPSYTYSASNGQSGFPTALAACQSLGGGSVDAFASDQAYCYTSGTTGYKGVITRIATATCPPGATLENGQCSCQAGYDEFENQCLPACAEGWSRGPDGMCKNDTPCPEGTVEQGGACVPRDCEPDEIRVNGVCVKEPPCPPGETRINGVCKKNGCEPGKDVGFRLTNGENTTYSCEEGCTIKTNASMCVTYDGVRECGGTGRMTGSTCKPGDGSGGDEGPGDGEPGDGEPGDGEPGDGEPGDGQPGGGDPEPPTLPPDLQPPAPVPPDPDTGKCPAGTQRYSNGNCYPPTPDPTPPDTDGKCPPGTVKVGTACVSPSPPGQPVPDTGTPENPNPGGGDGDGDGDGESGFGGSCMSGFACEGDAIFCAIAKEQHRRACKLFDDKSAESDLYDEAKAKTGDQTKDNPLNETINIAGRINQTDALGGGACIGDLNITVWGTSVNLPLAKLCPTLAMLGNLLVAVSMLVALRIITRG